VKRHERDTEYSHPYIAEVKNYGLLPPLSHMPSWRIASLIKKKVNFILDTNIHKNNFKKDTELEGRRFETR
jgi:hypothetical protein